MSDGPRHIAVVTGSRADYGLLLWPIRRILDEPSFKLSVIATGMHLAPAFGMTVDQIVADGIDVALRIETLGQGDDATAMAEAIGKGVAGFAHAFDRLRPDLVLLLGDRYEIFAAAQAAFFKIVLHHFLHFHPIDPVVLEEAAILARDHSVLQIPRNSRQRHPRIVLLVRLPGAVSLDAPLDLDGGGQRRRPAQIEQAQNAEGIETCHQGQRQNRHSTEDALQDSHGAFFTVPQGDPEFC